MTTSLGKSKREPHADKLRQTPEGRWLTQCRLHAGLHQCQLARVLGDIDPGLQNPGRVSEIETGKRVPSREIMEALDEFFHQRLGDACPPLPV